MLARRFIGAHMSNTLQMVMFSTCKQIEWYMESATIHALCAMGVCFNYPHPHIKHLHIMFIISSSSFFQNKISFHLLYKKVITATTYKVFSPSSSCVRQWIRKQIYVLQSRENGPLIASYSIDTLQRIHIGFHRQQQKQLYSETSPRKSQL